jgi:hypothetical protein
VPARISFPDAWQKEFRRRITEEVEKKEIEPHNPKRLRRRWVTSQRRIFVYSSNSNVSIGLQKKKKNTSINTGKPLILIWLDD